MNDNPTHEQLRELLRQLDDNAANHIAYVANDGTVNIRPLEGFEIPAEWAEENKGQYKFRLETFVQGNEYVGEDAAQDDVWVERLFNALKENWEKGTTGYVDDF